MNECKKEKRGGICFYNIDNVEFMKTKPDNYYDLAIVDPPYDFSISKTSFVAKGMHNKDRFQRHGGKKDRGGFVIDSKHKSPLQYAPSAEYWKELFRVSKHQIVFGGNYFTNYLPPSMAWIVWEKQNGSSYFSDCELAWTSFGCGLRMVSKSSSQKDRIHPTQKPVFLYEWIYLNYLPKAFSGRKPVFNKILDTHGGSGTHAIAADNVGIRLDILEIDDIYFQKSIKKYDIHKSQTTLF